MSCCANEIVRYTTPTIQITFKTIDPAMISEAFLVFKRAGTAVLTKDFTSATVEEHSISFTLSQADTGGFMVGSRVTVYCDWKLSDGTRGRSRAKEFSIADTGKDEVI